MSLDFNRAIQYCRNLPGYKLENTHFRIGSKYHSDTFLYAKGLFQNSFYSSRIALNIAYQISEICSAQGKKTITIVSYERYSELLLGIVRNFLNTMNPSLEVLLCAMVEKEEEMVPIAHVSPASTDYFIIVPIVSTGSTTQRLKVSFNKTFLQKQVLMPFGMVEPLAVFHIFHLYDPRFFIDLSIKPLYSLFVQWYKPYDCEKCFDNQQSQPLIEADKSNLNPVAIFGLPKIKTVYSILDPLKYKPVTPKEIEKGFRKMAVYGCEFRDVVFDNTLEFHYRNYSSEYRSYSHDLDTFISKNRQGIVNWLNTLIGDLNVSATDRVILLCPSHELTNLTFVNLVNDIVFGSSATIIYLEPEKEFPENFKQRNQDFLASDTAGKNKIFFVDDNLVTGKTFFSIYDLFRFSSNYGEVVLQGSIFLMNKASASTNERVIRASGMVNSYVAINQPQKYDDMDVDPTTRKITKVNWLMNRCLYYHEEWSFKQKLDRFNRFDTESFTPKEEFRYLKLFLSTHVLYQYLGSLSSSEAIKGMTFDDLFKKCKALDSRADDRISLMKALTQSSFTMYQPLRERVFEWLKQEVKDTVTSFYDIRDVNFEYKLERLLFVISRSSQLRNYEIVSSYFFSFLSGVLNTVTRDDTIWAPRNAPAGELITRGIPELTEYPLPDRLKEKIIRYYVELILNSGACAVKIKDNLIANEYTSEFAKVFYNALLDETYTVLNDLFEFIQGLGFSELFRQEQLSTIRTEAFSETAYEWFSSKDVLNSTRFEIAERVANIIERSEEGQSLSSRFAEYLLVKLILSDKKKDSHVISYKTGLICNHLKYLVSSSPKDTGVFFVVKDVMGKLRLIYDQDDHGITMLENLFDTDPVKSFFERLNKPLTKDRELVSYYDKSRMDQCPFISSLNGCEYLSLYRIASVKDNVISGFLGFYSSSQVFDDEGRRYLLLLRRDLQRFIVSHCGSEEFIQLLLTEERQRFAYLSGHGRDVMLRLGQKEKLFSSVVATLERLQGIFVANYSDPSQIRKRLDEVFVLRYITEADAEEIKDYLNKIAGYIYSDKEMGDIVEISENVELGLFEVIGEGKVFFHPDLIRFICFELLINAKKNRYQVVPGIFSLVHGVDTFDNRLIVKLCFNQTGATISVSGTGPKPHDSVMERINAGKSIKSKDDISGLDLIVKLIKVYNSNNSIEIHSEGLDSPTGVYLNTIDVNLIDGSNHG